MAPLNVIERTHMHLAHELTRTNRVSYIKDGHRFVGVAYGEFYVGNVAPEMHYLTYYPSIEGYIDVPEDRYGTNANDYFNVALQMVPTKGKALANMTEHQFIRTLAHGNIERYNVAHPGAHPVVYHEPGDNIRRRTPMQDKVWVNPWLYGKAYKQGNAMIHRLIDDLPEELKEILLVSRTFGLTTRGDIFRYLSIQNYRSNRMTQMAKTCPILVDFLAHEWKQSWLGNEHRAVNREWYGDVEFIDIHLVQDAVHEGMRLRDVLEFAELPKWTNIIPARCSTRTNYGQVKELNEAMPQFGKHIHELWAHAPKRHAQRWWNNLFINRHGLGFNQLLWVMKHQEEMDAGFDNYNVLDYLRAVTRENMMEWQPNMSVETTNRLQEEWHVQYYARQRAQWDVGYRKAELVKFDAPPLIEWVDGSFKVVPLLTSEDLVEEGKTMHHCVDTYADRVKRGYCYIYSVRKDDKPHSTVELAIDGSRVYIAQHRAFCNADPDEQSKQFLNKWLKEARKEIASAEGN
jgi:hypothetical protein